MVQRIFVRSGWHIQSLLLWLLQRPSLRWVPIPYPATSTKPKAWWATARRHWIRAQQVCGFTMQNLREGISLRNRMGFKLAFLDLPLLMGMLAARASKGMASKIRSEAIQEAKREAEKVKDTSMQQVAVRELIGPRGGLPTLRQDLLRLAALLHLEVQEKDTVAMVKEKCRPAADLLMAQRSTKHLQGRRKRHQDPPQRQEPAGASLLQVQELLAAQEGRFQTMFSQVMQHVMIDAAERELQRDANTRDARCKHA